MTVSNVHDLPCVPSADTMHAVVQRIFEHAGQLDGLIEIGTTDTRKGLKPPHPLNGGRKFSLAALDEAVEYAALQNANQNCNVYFSAGVCRVGSYEFSRATDADIKCVVACWVDLDAHGALQAAINIAESFALRPNLITYTGATPALRGQMWWIFDEPCADLALHRRLQIALVSKFGGDPSVINPSRVMRLCGSVAWPIKADRVLELTGIYADAEARAEPYSMDEFVLKMTRFGGLEAVAETSRPARAPGLPGAPSNVLDFSVAEPSYDLDGLIKRAAEPSQWHRHALLATAHLLGRGTPPDVVIELLTPALQQPGFSYVDTRNELGVMVQGALKRGLYHEAPPAPPIVAPGLGAAVEHRPSPFVSIDQLLQLPPPEWLVEGLLIETGVSGLFGAPGSFKSFVALDLGLSIAHGIDWHGRGVKQKRVLYICAEGQYGFGVRGLVWREHRAPGLTTDNFQILPLPVNFLDPACVDQFLQAVAAHTSGFDVFIVDTLARNFGEGDENSTKDMNAFVAGVSKLARAGAHVLVVHHVGKDAGKDERGSSAFRGALDGALRLDRDELSERVTLSVKKQKDGPEAEPISLVCVLAEAVHPLTGEIVTSRIPVLDEPVVRTDAVQAATESGVKLTRKQREALAVIDEGFVTLSTIAARLEVDKSNLRRVLNGLVGLSLITLDGDGFYRAAMPVSERKMTTDDHAK